MGWNDRLEDSELNNLPPEAYGNVFDVDGPFDPDDHWLERADREDQLTAMREWFRARFCDPAQDTPYNGREGGYLFIHGGPYDPADELPDRFSGIVGDDVIQAAIDDLHAEVGDQWAPIQNGPPDDYDEYDERFALRVVTQSEPLRRLRERLHQAKLVRTLEGHEAAKILAEKLIFGAALGALESFLWETAHYWVENDDSALHDIVTKLPVFRDETLKLGDIFKRHQSLREHVLGYLQNLVWHRWDKVKPLFKHGLGVDLPSLKPFEGPLIKRHDIVHRSGNNRSGEPIEVNSEEIDELCNAIDAFASEVDQLLAARTLTPVNEYSSTATTSPS